MGGITDRMSGNPDQYADTTGDATSDPQAGPQHDQIGATGEVIGDRLDDKHSGQDELVADDDLSEPVAGSGTPTPNPGPGGSPS